MDSNDRRDESGSVGLTRRAVLTTATVAAGALAGPAGAAAETALGGDFGQPFIELYVPGGALTLEQRSDIIAAFTDVVLTATKQSPDAARKLFVEIIETAEGGFGANGHPVPARK